jgi:hypothetical protein
VNEISSDARPDEIPREGNKGKRDGMLHTRLRRKQRKTKVVDDEIGVNGQGEGKRRCTGNWWQLRWRDGWRWCYNVRMMVWWGLRDHSL